VTSASDRRLALELLVGSAVVLFQELALIRWLGAQVRVLAYFPNLILLSAFLGLGVGCLRAGKRSLLPAWPPLLAVLAVVAALLGRVVFTQNSASEHLFLLYYDLPEGAPVVNDVRLPIVAFFLLSAASFVPLGQFVAVRLQVFRERNRALRGYSFDLLGSLAAVVAFTWLAFSGAFPIAWFVALLGLGGVLVVRSWTGGIGFVLAAAVILFVVARSERAEIYSPYYAIKAQPHGAGVLVLTNGSVHQWAVPLRRDRPMNAEMQGLRDGYHTPHGLLGRKPRHALVIGAGTGNDVSVLLDEGAERVDAVEIDPRILEIGRARHPDRPYASPRVRVFNTDARAHLNGTQEKYDLIVFGTLDSMTRLSALSNVRLDNFVYTVDCLRAARARLTDDGGVALYFMAGTDYIDWRLQGMIAEVFGEVPLLASDYRMLFNRIYMAGPAFAKHDGDARKVAGPAFSASIQRRVELPSDDWPFLYLAERGVGGFYLALMAVFGGVAVLAVLIASREMRESVLSRRRPDWEMFFFGLGFLLLETRSVTEMSLAWGATWLTSAIVFGSILLVVLLATLLTEARPLPYSIAMGGLVLSLLALYSVPTRWLLFSAPTPRLLLSVLFVGAPMFFAASAFATLFRDRASAATSFGWNLLGAVAGGLLEMASMELGLKALLLVALSGYLAAVLVHARDRPRLAALPVPTDAGAAG
jgi:hypothetical protein